MTTDRAGDCPQVTSLIGDCSAVQCIRTFVGGCVGTATLVDESCVCGNFTVGTCQKSCSGDIPLAGFYRWLNATCAYLPDWNGLPSDWHSVIDDLDVIPIGEINYASDYYGVPNYSSEIYVIPISYQFPACLMSQQCSQYTTDWYDCVFNSTEVYFATTGLTCNSGRGPSEEVPCGFDLYLDRSCACGSFADTIPASCQSECGSGINNTLYDLWLNRTCGGSHHFQALPANWTSSLQLVDNKTYVPTSKIQYPSCITGSDCYSDLNATQWNLTSVRCVLSGDDCSSTPTVVDIPQFLLLVQESELMPWAPVVEWNNSEAKIANVTSYSLIRPPCPSDGAKLGVFAAVNLVCTH